MPSQQLLADMGKFNQNLMAAGIMMDGGGLHPSSKGARVTFSGKDRAVTRGPFSNISELVSGYWIWKVKSLDEAIDWVKRCPNPMPEVSDIEIRLRDARLCKGIDASPWAKLMAHRKAMTSDRRRYSIRRK